MEFVLFLIYEVWAVYSGYKVMTGRSKWLEQDKPLNKIVKFGICLLLGNFVAVFYIFVVLTKLIIRWHMQ